ncbi:DnaD domain protein [Brevibacillus agri]|uniref:DnaD domain protein n=1 Tax=Brevibacillus agri TaxID=51101 RepID=UPI0002A507F0|nr:DnaD domain protein [Brevibacillus agri]ELK39068.1 primosome subunit [Brevibacillus agri BAB-2500]MDR9504732.1 DnaD domain protein [Brevibacillus agri]
MNYIRELNAFYDRLETSPLSTSAIALWHALMHINNKAGWIDTFAVAVSVLSIKTGLSERTITNARHELKQKGFIDFQSRKGNKSAMYKMISLSAINADSFSFNLSDSSSDSVSGNASALFKQNNTKPINLLPATHARSNDDPFLIYQQEIGKFTETIKDNMIDWLDGGYFEEPKSILVEAIKEAAIHEKRSWAYIDRVLRRCLQENVKTLEEMRQKKADHEQAKLAKVTPIRGGDAGAVNQRRRAHTDVPKPITKGEAGRLNKPDNYNERMLQVHGQGWLPDDVI